MTGIPPSFAERMRRLLGVEAEALLAALAEPPVAGLRVNTLKCTPARLREIIPWSLEPVPWCPSGFVIGDEVRAGKHPYHAAGLYYLQEPSAMAVAEALAPQPGDWVMDLAAAPGGKATHIAARLAGSGLLVANDIDARRARIVAQNVERCGIRNAMVTSETPDRLAERWGAVFDRVLFDAPCSGEGMFRKSEAARADWSEAHVRGCAARQKHGLDAAAKLVRAGGWLVYSTCTFAPEEDEQTVAEFLGRHADFELFDCALPGADKGRPEWLTASDNKRQDDDLSRTARIWPHRSCGDGHFVALLRRTDGPEFTRQKHNWGVAPKRAAAAWRDFAEEHGIGDLAGDHTITARGDHLWAAPPEAPPLDGLRIVQSGFALGNTDSGRFEPAHGMALALRAADASASSFMRLDFGPDDEPLRLYMQGHPLETAGPDGWVLVTASGFPLGWGRRAQGIVKNRYPKSLRIA